MSATQSNRRLTNHEPQNIEGKRRSDTLTLRHCEFFVNGPTDKALNDRHVLQWRAFRLRILDNTQEWLKCILPIAPRSTPRLRSRHGKQNRRKKVEWGVFQRGPRDANKARFVLLFNRRYFEAET